MADAVTQTQLRILDEIKSNGDRAIDASGNQHESLVEALYANKLMSADMKTDVVKAVDEAAKAQIAQEEADAATEKVMSEARNQAARDSLTSLRGLGEAFKSNLGDLKDGLKEDFSLLTVGFTQLSAQPGVRSIISILTFVSTILGKMLFQLVAGKFFKGLTAMTDGQIDMGITMKNIGAWAKGLVGMGPKIDKDTGEMSEDQRGMAGKGMDKVKSMADDLATKTGDAFKSVSTSMGEFFEPLTTGFSNLVEQGKEQNEKIKEGMTKFFEPLTTGFSEMKTNASDKLGEVGNNLSEWYKNKKEGVGNWLKDQAGAIKDGIKQSKAYGLLSKAGAFMSKAFSYVGRMIMQFIVTPLYTAIAYVVSAAVAFISSLIASAVAMLIPVLPIIAVVALIALIAVGYYFLYKYLEKNWEMVKEKFSIAFEQLSIWSDKAVLWISNMLAPLRDTLSMFFAKVMDALAGVVNSAISYINDMQPDWLRKIRGGKELISFRMSEDNVQAAEASAAIRASDREAQGADIAARESALADRRMALENPEQGEVAVSQQNNNVVNNNQKSTVLATKQEPTDRYAGMSAMAQ